MEIAGHGPPDDMKLRIDFSILAVLISYNLMGIIMLPLSRR